MDICMDQKYKKWEKIYMTSFEMCCGRSIEKINCADIVTNEEVLRKVQKKRSFFATGFKRKAN